MDAEALTADELAEIRAGRRDRSLMVALDDQRRLLAHIAALEADANSMHNASAALIRERDGLKTRLGHLEADQRERREEWAKRIDALEAENKQLRSACRAVFALISESQGVAGFHLNGDVATWDELMVGSFSENLVALQEVRGIVKEPEA